MFPYITASLLRLRIGSVSPLYDEQRPAASLRVSARPSSVVAQTAIVAKAPCAAKHDASMRRSEISDWIAGCLVDPVHLSCHSSPPQGHKWTRCDRATNPFIGVRRQREGLPAGGEEDRRSTDKDADALGAESDPAPASMLLNKERMWCFLDRELESMGAGRRAFGNYQGLCVSKQYVNSSTVLIKGIYGLVITAGWIAAHLLIHAQNLLSLLVTKTAMKISTARNLIFGQLIQTPRSLLLLWTS